MSKETKPAVAIVPEPTEPKLYLGQPGLALAKVVHFHLGSVALGGKQSLIASKKNTLVVTVAGIVAVSSASQRAVLFPWSNIIDVELYYGEETLKEGKN